MEKPKNVCNYIRIEVAQMILFYKWRKFRMNFSKINGLYEISCTVLTVDWGDQVECMFYVQNSKERSPVLFINEIFSTRVLAAFASAIQ